MKAVIQKIELKKIINRHYFKLELIDENGIKHVINNPFLSDPINFRTLVFGILSACNCYDLMRLATKNPIYKNMTGYYYMGGLHILDNENGKCLIYDERKRLYTCLVLDTIGKAIIDNIIKSDPVYNDKMIGKIESITSQSGTFSLFLASSPYSTCFITKQIYYGFEGLPSNIGISKDKEHEILFAKMFTSFIISLMKLYEIDDLLDFGGIKDNLPIVEITLNNNKISSITSPLTRQGLLINSKYSIIKTEELEEKENKMFILKKKDNLNK